MSSGRDGRRRFLAISRAIGAGDRDRAATLALSAAMIGACAEIFFTVTMLIFGHAFYALLGGRGGVLERIPLVVTVLPCQCGVCRSTSVPSVKVYQRTR